MRNTSFLNSKGRLVKQPFQTGIIVSIQSVRHLYHELRAEGISYLLTSKVNQDALENIFSSI